MKKLAKEENAKVENTMYYKYVRDIRSSGENLKCVVNEIIKHAIMKITERSFEK